MKKYILLFMVGLLSVSCNGQNNEKIKSEKEENKTNIKEEPKGTWKVDKEFDENGNLIKYDSVYSWSSHNKLDNLSSNERDSLMHSLKSRFFTNYSGFENQWFDDVFSRDSLFSKRFFNDDFFDSNFGKDFMDLDKLRQQMMVRQKKFLEKYHSEFNKPKTKTK
ncbi:hypothetical protein [Polaribacter sp.]|uniref:hypothetical protein n=1 Tax=Polaribacter sp. TaxID=1920175 RepID=UPI003EF2BCBC